MDCLPLRDLEFESGLLQRGVCLCTALQGFRRRAPHFCGSLRVSTKYRCHRLCHLQMSLLDGGVGRRVGAEPAA